MVYVYWVVDTVGPVGTTIAPSGLTTNATVSFDESVTGVSDVVGAARHRCWRLGSGEQVVSHRTLSRRRPAVARTCAKCCSSRTKAGCWASDTAFSSTQTAPRQSPTTSATSLLPRTPRSASRPGPKSSAPATRGAKSATTRRAAIPTSSSDARVQVPRGSFSGGTLTWVTMTGPAHGKAELYVDGALRGTLQQLQRAGSVRRRAKPHRPRQRTAHRRGARRSARRVHAPAPEHWSPWTAFVTASGSVATPVVTQSWQRSDNANASNGYYSIADLSGTDRNLGVPRHVGDAAHGGRSPFRRGGALRRRRRSPRPPTSTPLRWRSASR